MVTGGTILTGGSGINRGALLMALQNRGPHFIGWLEMDRDGLLYVLTHRSSHGTLIDEVLQKPRLENDWDPFLISDFSKCGKVA